MPFDLPLLGTMPKQVAVAWSGGLDSTALVLLLQDAGFDVQLWHVDHGWSKQSGLIAEALAQQAKFWGLSFHLRHTHKAKSNIEAEARKHRYQAFAALAKETGCKHIVLGHHAEDQAETVCMRLLQGAGVAGCQGMKNVRQQQCVTLWRPLLTVRKERLKQFLICRQIEWHEDVSNQDVTIWRNKIRHKLFPAMKARQIEPSALFLRWQKQAERIQTEIEGLAQAVTLQRWQQDSIVVCAMNWEDWCGQLLPVRVYLLQKMVGMLFVDGSVLGRRHIHAIETWREQGGHGWLNLSGCCLYRHEQDLQLCQGKVSLRKRCMNSET
ncbi:tRNA lysidine(34) synthetase TilS [Ghiorsea bivora]|uniref:tRNA lysidine(34) synthetase TilS n=1 Tax=Ghiorsea bivora TaxID=1485545 RepID=UPI00068F26E0|nr:tRNA lysidine(34) synthetase TilS [Ghiorsea bivora]